MLYFDSIFPGPQAGSGKSRAGIMTKLCFISPIFIKSLVFETSLRKNPVENCLLTLHRMEAAPERNSRTTRTSGKVCFRIDGVWIPYSKSSAAELDPKLNISINSLQAELQEHARLYSMYRRPAGSAAKAV